MLWRLADMDRIIHKTDVVNKSEEKRTDSSTNIFSLLNYFCTFEQHEWIIMEKNLNCVNLVIILRFDFKSSLKEVICQLSDCYGVL